MNEPSIFTRIINGEIPCHKIYEDDTVIAFLDIHPINPGHVLVVPKQQIQYVWDLDDVTYQHLMNQVGIIGRHIREVIGCERVGIIVEGFDVPHAHVKLVPLYSPRDTGKVIDDNLPVDHDALTAMADKLKM